MSLILMSAAAVAYKNLDRRIIPLLISDLILTPLMATNQTNDLEVIVRDTIIRFSSLFIVSKIGMVEKVKQTISSIGGAAIGQRGQFLLAIAVLHTVNMTYLRILGLTATSNEDVKGVRGSSISQRVMKTQLGVPVLPLADIAVIAGASLILSLTVEENFNAGLLLFLLALGGRQPMINLKIMLQRIGIPVGQANGLSVMTVLASLALGGGFIQSVVGAQLTNMGIA